MTTETLTKLNPKILINSKLDPNGSDSKESDQSMTNTELNKVPYSKKTESKPSTASKTIFLTIIAVPLAQKIGLILSYCPLSISRFKKTRPRAKG